MTWFEDLTGIAEHNPEHVRGQLELEGEWLKIGIQRNAEATLPGADHTFSQDCCSALTVAYRREPGSLWKPFARLVLEAAYDAVFCAARVNRAKTGRNQLFLTWTAGGAFGNRNEWIIDVIERAVRNHRDSGLEVQIVSYGCSQLAVAELIERAGRL
mgnify:CR=1 FL=1